MERFIYKKIDFNDINEINELQNNGPVTIILKNTKDQNPNILRYLNPYVKVRVLGGLDYTQKPKYRQQKYLDRATYTPPLISNIISEFEKIESKIDPTWSDLEKAAFVYGTLANGMRYDYEMYDVKKSSNLEGVLTRESICAGYALIYKEIMDRIGVECLYLNKQHTHAWNAIKIDGVYYPVDLTWDSVDAYKMPATFRRFANDPNFNAHPSHQADNGDPIIPSNTLPRSELRRAFIKVGVYSGNNVLEMKRDNNTSLMIYDLGKSIGGLNTYACCEKGKKETKIIYSEISLFDDYEKFSENKKHYFKNEFLSEDRINRKLIETDGYVGQIQDNSNDRNFRNIIRGHMVGSNSFKYQSYNRSDGSNFVLSNKNYDSDKQLWSFDFNEMYLTNDDKYEMKTCKIYSEKDLLHPNNTKENYAIANLLLSQERIEKKTKNVGGYVGTVDLLNGLYTKFVDIEKEKQMFNYKR